MISEQTLLFITTKLIYNYFSEKEYCNFDLNTFLLSLYYDLIKEYIENYNPKKVFIKLIHKYFYEQEASELELLLEELFHTKIFFTTLLELI